MSKRDLARPSSVATNNSASISPALAHELSALVESVTRRSIESQHGARETKRGEASPRERWDPKLLRAKLSKLRAEIEREQHRHESGARDVNEAPPSKRDRDVVKALKDLEDYLESVEDDRALAETAFSQLSQRTNQLSAAIAAIMKSQAESAAAGTRGIS